MKQESRGRENIKDENYDRLKRKQLNYRVYGLRFKLEQSIYSTEIVNVTWLIGLAYFHAG